ncbi:MAG: hypothetical protein J5564_00130, partial [Clostridia bacterium]|nr:hypothetical protein [Clostridia bacterium]
SPVRRLSGSKPDRRLCQEALTPLRTAGPAWYDGKPEETGRAHAGGRLRGGPIREDTENR